jgi:hypothetical protein
MKRRSLKPNIYRKRIPSRILSADQVQRLFAVATMVSSEAEGISISGQSSRRSMAQRKRYATQIRLLADDLAKVSDNILAALRLNERPGFRSR